MDAPTSPESPEFSSDLWSVMPVPTNPPKPRRVPTPPPPVPPLPTTKECPMSPPPKPILAPLRAPSVRRPAAPRPLYPARARSNSRSAARASSSKLPSAVVPESPALPLMLRIPTRPPVTQPQRPVLDSPRFTHSPEQMEGPGSRSPSPMSATPTSWSRPSSAMSSFIHTPSTSPPPADGGEDVDAECDEEYYLRDEMATFLVERRLFRVHRYFLERESPYFKRTFLNTLSEDLKHPFDSRPIQLSDVTIEEFRSLLDFIYKGMHNDPQPASHWTSLLSLATKYEFPAIRHRAIAELSQANIEPVAQVVLAVTYGVPEWLRGAYRRVALRDAPLEEAEAEKLGLRTTVRLAKVREVVRAARALRVAPGSEAEVEAVKREEETIAGRVVEEVFGLDLA